MTGYSLVSSLFVVDILIGGAPIGTELRLVAVAWERDKNRDGEVCCDSQYDPNDPDNKSKPHRPNIWYWDWGSSDVGVEGWR